MRIYPILLLIILITAIVEFSGLLSKADYQLEQLTFDDASLVAHTVPIDATRQHKLGAQGAQAVQIRVEPSGFIIDALVRFDALGYENGETRVFYGVGGTVKEVRCANLRGPEPSNCSFSISLNGEEPSTYTLFVEGDEIAVQNLRLDEYRAKRATQLSGTLIFYYFFLLASCGFIFRCLSENASKRLLVAFSGLFLLFLSVKTFSIIFLFVGSSYFFIKKIIVLKDRDKRLLLVTLFSAITFLVVIKFLVPVATIAFLNPGQLPMAMPLGLSYFVIKIIDITLDAYRRKISDIGPTDFLCFLLFPCTLPAGPIKSFRQYINFRVHDYSIIHYASGIGRTALGVIKKLLADAFLLPLLNARLLNYVELDAAEAHTVSLLTFELLFLNLIYIYVDFSAYCDMAIGSARSMGFTVPENFRWPLLRRSVSEYWQNWHKTLTNWAGKNVFMNVMLMSRSVWLATLSTMLCIGLWHRPSLGWLGWAAHHTFIMRAEDKLHHLSWLQGYLTRARVTRRLISTFSIPYVWYLVALGQSFIIFSDINLSLAAYKAMLMAPYFLIVDLIQSYLV